MIWNNLQEFIISFCNVERGQHCKICPKDAWFVLLIAFEHGDVWDEIASVFRLKAHTFQIVLFRFATLIVNNATRMFMDVYLNNYSMAVSDEQASFLFIYFSLGCRRRFISPLVLFFGSIEEVNWFYIGNYKLYGCKAKKYLTFQMASNFGCQVTIPALPWILK